MPNINNLDYHSGRTIKEDGTIKNIADAIQDATDTTNDGIKTTSLYIEIARENVPNAELVNAIGKYVATGGEVNHLIWGDGTFNIPATSGVQMSISSTSTQDGAGGTGIRTLELNYLDNNLIPRVEIVTLNGTTPVLTVATNIRFIQYILTLTAGTSKGAVGIITASNGGVTYNNIPATSRISTSSARMVPAGKKLYIVGVNAASISGTASAGAQIKISSTYSHGHDLTSQLILVPFGNIGVQDGSIVYLFPIPAGGFLAGTIVAMEVTVDKASTITGDWYGWLENV